MTLGSGKTDAVSAFYDELIEGIFSFCPL